MENGRRTFASPADSPQPVSPGAGAAQRAALQARLNGLRWWTVNGSLLAAFAMTALAIRHTNAVSAATISPAPLALAQPATAGSSLFQGQGDIKSSNGSSFLAPAPSTGQAAARTRTS